jgi:hypothetical protein
VYLDRNRPSFARDRSVSRSHSKANSTGVKEELLAFVDGISFLTEKRFPPPIIGNITDNDLFTDVSDLKDLAKGKKDDEEARNRNLSIAFVAMVFVGLCNRVFNKLMTIPMHNYPNFLNLLTTFVYLPVCFAYIIPMAR